MIRPALLCALLVLPMSALQAFQQAKDPVQVRADDEPPRLKPPPPQESTNLRPTLLERASATVSVITGADLQTLGVSTFTDALRIVPGLEVQKLSASESGVSVRSYSGPGAARQGILGLVDGRQVYNEFFGGVWWETIPVALDEIKKIEVIRGPSSFLYGPNAMHGLVNIVTKSPTDYDEGESTGRDFHLSVAGGSYAANQESLTYVKREGQTGLKVTIAHDDMDEFESRGDTKNKIFADIQFKSKLEEGQELQLFAGASRQKFNVFFPSFDLVPPSPNPTIRVPTANYITRANEYYLQANYTLFEHLKMRASWTRFEADGVPSAVYMPFSLLLDTGDVDLQYSFSPFEANLVTLGTGYRYTTFNTSSFDISDGRHGTGLGWFFLQDEMKIFRELFLTAGARLDHHSVTGVTVSPRAALVWEFVPSTSYEIDGKKVVEPGQSLRVTASAGYREPSLRDLWFNMQIDPTGTTPPPPGALRVVGNKDLKPEEIRSFEIGYWGRPTPRLQAECSIYYNLYDELFVFQPNGATPTLSRHNVNREDTYGIELNSEYQLTHEIYVFGNYAYEIRRDRTTHDPNPSAPRHKVNAGVRIINEKSLSGMLWINFFDHTEFIDKTSGDSLGEIPSYTLVNAKLWYPLHIGKAEGKVFVQAFNLLNNVHREYIQSDAYGLIAMAGIEIVW